MGSNMGGVWGCDAAPGSAVVIVVAGCAARGSAQFP